jgi:hypothetical protein
MIDKNIVEALLSTTSSKNMVGIGMELKPYELALHMVQSLNNSEDYGYVVMGVSKLLNSYAIEGVSPTLLDRAKEPILTALRLISHEIEVEYGNICVDGKNIFVVMLKNSDKTFSVGFIKDFNSQDIFIKNLVRACLNLQTRKHYIDASEDERNDYIGDILDAIGYVVKDQTRRGSSATGKDAGEVDIFISKDGLPFTVIEAMNLDCVNTVYIDKHINKVFLYDTAGNKFNACLSYVKVSDFISFWEKYSAHVSNHNYTVPLISADTSIDDEYGFSELKVMKTVHNRSGREVALYHVCVRIH